MARVCLYYGHRGARLVALLGGGRNAGMHLEGHVRLQNQLKALSKPMQKQALEYAVLQGANIIKNEASQRAPTGPRGGQRLRRSISAEKKKVLQKGVARYGISWITERGHPKNAFWGLFVEKGTNERFRKSWRYKPLKTGPVTTGVMPTRPFLEPAYDAKKGAAVAEIKKELWALVKKIAKRSKNIG